MSAPIVYLDRPILEDDAASLRLERWVEAGSDAPKRMEMGLHVVSSFFLFILFGSYNTEHRFKLIVDAITLDMERELVLGRTSLL
jgi:hypothetical protein